MAHDLFGGGASERFACRLRGFAAVLPWMLAAIVVSSELGAVLTPSDSEEVPFLKGRARDGATPPPSVPDSKGVTYAPWESIPV